MSLLSIILILSQNIFVQGFFHEHSIKTFKRPLLPEQCCNRTKNLFGYSISNQNHSLIVSDPIFDGIGSVYLMDIDTPYNNASVTVTVDDLRKSKNAKTTNHLELAKHEYWFGASVAATDDFFLACAPRYAEFKTLDKKKSSATVGLCYLKPSDGVMRMLPALSNHDRLRTEKRKEALMDSFGWSTHITSKNEILVGGPAISKGRVIKHETPMSTKHPKMFDKISRSNPVLYNFGYSIASGKFFGPEISYAVSTTFGNLGFGKVYFFNSKLDNIGAINDNTFSSMFGATLCSVMLPYSALIIGAPVYSDDSTEYDVGAVYIYMANTEFSSNEMFLKQKIKGNSSGGYFGNAILNLGDLDGDSYDEVAIAAPYENEGNGAIYIYTGKGILEGRYTQRIQQEWFRNFGFSMTVVRDYDGNGCNELAVSSPSSDKIVMLKSLAFVTVKLRAEFPKNITIGEYFEFKSCIDVIYPKKLQEIEADVIITLQSTIPNATLSRLKAKGSEIVYEQSLKTKASSYCENIGVTTIFATEKDHDLVLAYKITARQKVNPIDLKDFKISRVLLSENSELNIEDSIYTGICEGGRCIPKLDLTTNFSMLTPYMIGSTDEESLTLNVSNTGDTSYSSCVLITMSKARFSRYPQECSLQFANKLLCKPRVPLKNGSNWIFKDIFIDTTYLTSLDDTLDIIYNLYDNCNELSNKKTNEVSFQLISDFNGVSIKGEIIPDKFINMTMNDLQYGKIIEHRYTLVNNVKINWINVQSEIILENGPFVRYSDAAITINTGSSLIECPTPHANETEGNITVLCDIGDLRINDKITVAISIEIPPNVIGKSNYDSNFTVSTGINLIMKEQNKYSSLQTLLRVQRHDVPLWVIIISSIIGLILVIIIGYILYKSGFLRRKNKDQLTKLKKSVYRQSLHRTAMRESIRATTSRKSTEDAPFLKPGEFSRTKSNI